MQTNIDEKNFQYLGITALDRIGRVFEYEGKILRGIYSDQVEFVNELLKSGLIEALVDKNLFVRTKISKYKSKQYSLILEHEKLTATYPTSWTFSMLKDAAKTILTVNKLCNKYGYELHDAHPNNIAFTLNTPKWIDFGSIQKKDENRWIAHSEFINDTIVPLVLIQNNELLEGYSLLLSGRLFKVVSKPFRETLTFKLFLKLIGESVHSFSDDLVDQEWIDENCKTDYYNSTQWGTYQKNEKEMQQDLVPAKDNRFMRFFRVADLVNTYSKDAKTSVDLAGSNGLLSAIISKKCDRITKLINTDYDSNAIEKSYKFFKANNKYKTETYLLNFMLPMQKNLSSVFKSDIAFALAVTHHLLLTQGHKIDEIFEKISSFSNKYVYIEFMPLGMWGGDQNIKPVVPEWYNIDWFEKAFKKHFKFIYKETIESHVINGNNEAHRVLFIGEIKK